MSSQKYMLAGALVAGVAVWYSNYNKMDINKVSSLIEENKSKFSEIIEELVSLSLDLLERIVAFLKKVIIEGIFKLKMSLGIA